MKFGERVRLTSKARASGLYVLIMLQPMWYEGPARQDVLGQKDIDDVRCQDGKIRCVEPHDIERDDD